MLDYQITRNSNEANGGVELEKRKDALIKDGQDLVRFYEVEPSAVAGVSIALNRLQRQTTKRDASVATAKLPVSDPAATEVKPKMKPASACEQKTSLPDTARSPLAADKPELRSATDGKPSAPDLQSPSDQKSLSTSSTESDLYEEITPRPLDEDNVQPEVQRKVEECEQNLVKVSRQQGIARTEKRGDCLRQKEMVNAPFASLEESIEQEVRMCIAKRR